MASLLYRLGTFAARRRWAVLATWLTLLVAVGAAAAGLAGTMSNSFSIPGTPAQRAMDLLEEKLPAAGGSKGRIVFAAPDDHSLTEPAYQQAIANVVTGTSTLDGVTGVIDPNTAKTYSDGARIAFAQVSFAGDISSVPEATQRAITELADDNATDGLRIEIGGAAAKQTPSIGSTEAIGVVVALVVLLVTFGSIVAAGMPMLTALIGLGVGMGGILAVSGWVQMSSTAPILALMLGLAVGIDYALFIVSKHRKQVAAGMDLAESIGRANGTAGSAVVFAGLTVVIALAGLSIVGIPFLTIMGLAAAGTVAVAVLIAVTLLPALLAFAGDRILPKKQRAAAARLRETGVSVASVAHADDEARTGRWIRVVTRRPATVLVAGVLALAAIALPTFSLHLSLPDDGTASVDDSKRKAYDLLADGFGPGFNGPLIVTVSPSDPAAVQASVGAVAERLSTLDNVDLAIPAGVADDGSLGVIQVIPETGPSDERTETLVHDIRDLAGDLGTSVGADIAVTGQTAMVIDISEKLAAALPVYLLLVVGLALVLLLLVFRSIVVPIKAALGFLLTVGVSFGAVVAVYQWGWLGFLFGVDTPAPIISFLPILLTGVLFGLAMDYEVFLVAGMRESYVHGGDARRGVVQGFNLGVRVVTAAAIIMTSVFAGFILAPDTIIASIGFALGVGVLVDAFVVRMTLVPAVMTLLGRSAWYLPKWLDRILPNVDVEGEQLLKKLSAETPPAEPELVGADR